jgi:two-component system NtrC family response regulator
LRRFSPEQNIDIDDRLMQRLSEHRWPGNIRELENLTERMVVLRKSDRLTVGDLPSDFGEAVRPMETAPAIPYESLSFHEAEKNLILSALERFNWNRSRAAEYLKIPRHILIYRMKKYSITGANPKGESAD